MDESSLPPTSPNDVEPGFTPDEWEACLRVLRVLARDPFLAPDVLTFKGLVKKCNQTAKRKLRAAQAPDPATQTRRARRQSDRVLLEQTALVQADRAPDEVVRAPAASPDDSLGTLHTPIVCYVCKQKFQQVHAVYHRLCPRCARENLRRRSESIDLSARTALVTGGRIKIGFETSLRLLRAGARVIVTTRFPARAAQRFAAEADFPRWKERLQVCGLDFRHLASVEAFCRWLLETEPALDILINNAAQTLGRSPAYQQQLARLEHEALAALPAPSRRLLSGFASPTPHLRALTGPADGTEIATYDRFGDPLDESLENSWTQTIEDVGTRELLEVQIVNSTVPFLLCSRLKPLMTRSPYPRRFIVNVSSKEGQFSAQDKREHHPHTNMAKAALNMLTRTSAAGYARDGIYMNSVDPGWVSQEGPLAKEQRLRAEEGFVPPLDLVDAAARVCAPIVDGLRGEPQHGQLFKDYAVAPW